MSSTGATVLPPVPPELVEAGVSGTLVVLIGAGAAYGSGLPLWNDLLEGLLLDAKSSALPPEMRAELEELERWYSTEQDQLLKASAIAQLMGDPWLAGRLSAKLRSASAHPSHTHRALAELPGTIFVTTNYDGLLEQALAEHTGKPPKVVLPDDVEGLRDFGPGQLLKLHGDLDRPETIVLKVEDYFRISHGDVSAWKHRLDALLQPPHRVLLVGYSYSDIDIQEVVNALRGAYKAQLAGPFWLTLENGKNKAKAKASGLRGIWLSDFDQLVPWLRALIQGIHDRKAAAPAAIKAAAYATAVRGYHEEEQQHANELFDKGDYEGARDAYLRLRTKSEQLVLKDPENEELQRLLGVCQLNAASCLLCLQDAEALPAMQAVARESLARLRVDGRATLAEGLAQLGDRALAREVLPEGDASPRVKAVRQLIEVLEGHLPGSDREPSSLLTIQIIQLLLKRGRLSEVAHEAVRLLDKHPNDTLILLSAAPALTQALFQSVFEVEGAQWIPAEERGGLLSRVENALAQLGKARLSRSLRILQERFRLGFSHLVHDTGGMTQARKALEDLGASDRLGRSDDELERLRRAETLAREGRLEAALQLLPQNEAHWSEQLHRIEMVRVSGDRERALKDVLELAQFYPNRAPIEFIAALLLRRASRPDEALTHARSAFEALPGRGMRLLLGQCLNSTGKLDAARAVLEPLADSQHPEILIARATAAEASDLNGALSLWRQYRALEPGDSASSFRIAALLFQLARHQDAAEEAWRLFEEHREQLTPAMLAQCAQFQHVGRRLDNTAKERLRQVARVLEERYPGNHEAEFHRLQLLLALGSPEEAAPIDFQRLVASGLVQAVPIDRVKELIRHDRELSTAAYQEYRQGRLPFESLCELTGAHAASYFARMVGLIADRRSPPVLCTPVPLASQLPIPSLAGQQLLLGELELLVLQQLGLLGKLREAFGRGDGQVIIFRDVWEKIADGAAELEQRTQRVALERLERLLTLLYESPKVDVSKDPHHTDDVAWAAQQSLPIVDTRSTKEDRPHLAPGRLVLLMSEQSLIDNKRRDRLLQTLFMAPQPEAGPPDPLPSRFAMTFAPLMIFFEQGVLELLLDIVPDKLVVGPATSSHLRERRDELKAGIFASDLANALQRVLAVGRAEGWVSIIERPMPDLPPLPPLEDPESTEQLIRKPLLNGLSYRQLLLNDPHPLLVAADFFVTKPLGADIREVSQLAWRSPQAFMELASRLRSVNERVIYMAPLVRHLLPGESSRPAIFTLARLGFTDALRAEELLFLARHHRGLDTGEPSALLSHTEWMARTREHSGAAMAGLRLAGLYAEAIWEAFDNEAGFSNEAAQALATTLLARAENVDQAVHGRLLTMLLGFLCLLAVGAPKKSFEASGDMMQLSPESDAGRLWTFLHAWAGLEGPRRAAFDQALRDAWIQLDRARFSEKARDTRALVLLLPLMVERITLTTPALTAAAVITANWRHHPLSRIPRVDRAGTEPVDLETLLESWAKRLANGEPKFIFNEEELGMNPPAVGTNTADLAAPESVLLRIRDWSEAARQFARDLAVLQGVHDGRIYDLLMKLSEDPKNPELRRVYAQQTLSAPWRSIREDPSLIQTWGWRRRYGTFVFPSQLKDVRDLLSEPRERLDEKPLRHIITERMQHGIWEKRLDDRDLFELSCEVPGLLPSLTALPRVAQGEEIYQADVERALTRLSNPEMNPAPRLAGDIFFLRLAASRRPYIQSSTREVDLREQLVDLLPAVLRSAMNSPTVDTLAEAEAGLLRLCATVIHEMAEPEPLPFRDGLWLTYRLFQWLWFQLERMPPDARVVGQRALRELSPPSVPGGHNDLLHPLHFERTRIDYRLMTLLYAFSFMEDLPRVAPAEDEAEPGPDEGAAPVPPTTSVGPISITSPALEGLLIELASRPLTEEERALRERGDTPSSLDWHGPSAIPDLALAVLLRLNDEAVLRLPVEQRLRWLTDVPRSPEDKGRVGWPLAQRLLLALARKVHELVSEERRTLEEHLKSLVGFEGALVVRCFGFAQLYGAGHLHLKDEVEQFLLEALSHPLAPRLFGSYLSALSHVAPGRLASDTERLLQQITDKGMDPVPFAASVATVIVLGAPEVIPSAQELLRRLATKPPYSKSAQMRQILSYVGMQ